MGLSEIVLFTGTILSVQLIMMHGVEIINYCLARHVNYDLD